MTYQTDFVIWAEDQAAALRRRATNEIDWENVAEEIESLANRDKRELASRIQIVLEHLIRLQASPATEPRHGWERTLITQREEIRKLLKDSPTLRSSIAKVIADELPVARRLALLSLADYAEMPTVDVETLSFDEDEVLSG